MFELSQARADGENLQLMEEIAVFLECNLEYTRGNKEFPQYRVRTQSLKGNLLLAEYFKHNQLMSSKF
jgi:hypothetical protein